MRSFIFFLVLLLCVGWTFGKEKSSGDEVEIEVDVIYEEGSGPNPPNLPHNLSSPVGSDGSGVEIDIEYRDDDEGSGHPKPIPNLPDTRTGAPEESTMPPKDPLEDMTDEPELIEEEDGPTTPFDINNIQTGVPEGPTKEPYYPKPIKPHPDEEIPESSGSGFPINTEEPSQSYTELPGESIAPEHWRTTTTSKWEFTVSQKMDENSPGYKQLLHMLEDLNNRRSVDTTSKNQTDFYISRVGISMDTIDNSFTNPAIANISAAQQYINGLLDGASLQVRQGYSQIVSLTSTPSFYYIPKRQRYLMVNKIITDMGSAGEREMMSLNSQAKVFCQKSNVDTPSYTLGNISGNKLGNGAILTK